MGSFSWLKADNLGRIGNIYGQKFKFLIPEEFGGGCVIDEYQDYGDLTNHQTGEHYDMYEILAFWNMDKLGDNLRGDLSQKMPVSNVHTSHNRCLGIDIGCYGKDIAKLKYPLKLVSMEYEGSYEDCPVPSYGDPNQGFFDQRRDMQGVGIKLHGWLHKHRYGKLFGDGVIQTMFVFDSYGNIGEFLAEDIFNQYADGSDAELEYIKAEYDAIKNQEVLKWEKK